jgi:hypothetical protein
MATLAAAEPEQTRALTADLATGAALATAENALRDQIRRLGRHSPASKTKFSARPRSSAPGSNIWIASCCRAGGGWNACGWTCGN